MKLRLQLRCWMFVVEVLSVLLYKLDLDEYQRRTDQISRLVRDLQTATQQI